jgi:GT2 family glycosyltransferase
MQLDDKGSRSANYNLSDKVASRAQTDSEPMVSGWVDCASWLSDDVLLIIGWFHTEEDGSPNVSLILDKKPLPLEIQCFSYPRPDLFDADPRVGKVIVARFLRPEDAHEPLGSVMIETDSAAFALGPLKLSQAMTDLQTLTQVTLVGLDTQTRASMMAFFLLATVEYCKKANTLQLNKSLFVIRETLRERHPECVIGQDIPRGIAVDTVLTIDEETFYVRGWMRDEEEEITHLTAVTPEGARVELLERIFRYPRPDVEQFYGVTSNELLLAKNGFISFFEVGEPSRLPTGWTFEMRNAAGEAVEVAGPSVVRDPLTVRGAILADISYERPPFDDLMPKHIFPAISRQQTQFQEMVEVESVLQFGTPPESPDVSIIIPLYKRVDFLEQQLAQFVHDPEILQSELIYVLDSPELADAFFRDLAAQLFAFYRVPFQVVLLKRNSGFSAVNNVGARLADGRLLLLLNSDVLPDEPGWLGKLIAFYDSTPGVGALGPKLLYEDDSLQHAGLYFYRQRNGLWNNEHYFKGFNRYIPVANKPRPVPSVTGACMMIDRSLYERFGGFRGVYVQGDYEDSDLCLRLIEAGYENWYLPDAELYHLEGQSYVLASRQLNGRYNAWLHTHLWEERIEAVMERYTSAGSDKGAAYGSGGLSARRSSEAAGSTTRKQEGAVKKSRTRPEKRSKQQAGKNGHHKG